MGFVMNRGGRLAAIMLASFAAMRAQETPAYVDDAEFSKWEKRHVLVDSVLEADEKTFSDTLKKMDSVTRSYLALRSTYGGPKSEGAAMAVQVMDEIGSGDANSLALHPLIGHMLFAFIEGAGGSAQYMKLAGDLMDVIGAKSCPYKDYIDFSLLNREHEQAQLMSMLRKIADYRSSRSRRKSLGNFVSKLPKAHRPAFKRDLQLLTADFPALRKEFDWLAEGLAPEAGKKGELPPAVAGFLKKSQCPEAVEAAGKAVTPTSHSLDEALSVYDEIAKCFKRFRLKDRVAYWEQLQPALTKAYDWKADAHVLKRLSHTYWAVNHFVEAKQIAAKAIEAASARNDHELLAEFLYHEVLILENEGNIPGAIASLERLEGIPAKNQELMANAMRIHALLVLEKEEWKAASAVLAKIIAAQDLLPEAQKDVSFIGFALFWQGYAEFQMKETMLAQRAWRRLALDYYSTYYGAVGQFLLERTGGAAPAPEAKREFAPVQMEAAFGDEQRLIVRRVMMLLDAGQHDQANCELEELEMGLTKPEQAGYLALLYYASGRWFKAIQLFAELPRTVRDRLPRAFEKILFPRKYEDEILAYSGRLGLDPFLVMALVRQESIFNRFAKSPVGAMGVMQLMNTTALQEVNKMPDTYLDRDERDYIRQRTGKDNWLFDVKVNLPIGIHHLFRLFKESESVTFSLAGYNAGGGAVKKWQETLSAKNLPLFVERIPYRETRNYVKLILRNYFYYKRIYGGKTDEFPHLEAYFKDILDKTQIN